MTRFRRTVYLCDGARCGLAQCRELAARVTGQLGVGMNQRTPDGMIAIRSLRCREHPAVPPLLMIDDDRFEIGDWEDLERILAGMKSSFGEYA